MILLLTHKQRVLVQSDLLRVSHVHKHNSPSSTCNTKSTCVPMPRWGWVIAYALLLDPQHMQFIVKTHADASSHC